MQKKKVSLKKLIIIICKSLISLTTSNEYSIETIELKPVLLKQKDINYLRFWYGNGFGKIEANCIKQKNKTCLLGIYCSK